MSAKVLPSAMRESFRLNDILKQCKSLDLTLRAHKAVVHCRGLGLTEHHLIPPRTLFMNPYLRHWASKRGCFPALVALADDGINRALHVTFFDGLGRPVTGRESRLLLGAPNGACVRLSEPGDGSQVLWLTQDLDDALSIFARSDRNGVWCALSLANLGKVILPAGVEKVLVVMRTGSAQAREEIRAALAAQGARVVIQPSGMTLYEGAVA